MRTHLNSKNYVSTWAFSCKSNKCQELVHVFLEYMTKKRLKEMRHQSLEGKPLKKFLPEDYLDLINAPTKLFHPYRLLIMKTLVLHGNVEFRQLRHNIPEITDGNLASHLRVLEKSEYVHCHKEVVNRKLRTSYEVTEKGIKDFEQLATSLGKMIAHESNV